MILLKVLDQITADVLKVTRGEYNSVVQMVMYLCICIMSGVPNFYMQ